MAQGTLSISGTLAARLIHPKRAPLLWKVKNFRNVWPGLWRHELARLTKSNHMLGTLRAVKYGADGKVTDYGLVSARQVTTDFCEFIGAQLITETSVFGDFKYHETGTGGGAEDPANDSLTFSTEMVGDVRGTGTQVQGSSTVKYKSVATITYDGAGGAITEHGLFNDTRAAGGVLMDRHLFGAINVVAADSIAFTYELTLTAGG